MQVPAVTPCSRVWILSIPFRPRSSVWLEHPPCKRQVARSNRGRGHQLTRHKRCCTPQLSLDPETIGVGDMTHKPSIGRIVHYYMGDFEAADMGGYLSGLAYSDRVAFIEKNGKALTGQNGSRFH